MKRAVHFHDLRAVASFGTLMVSGAITLAIKDALHAQDPLKRWQPQKPEEYLKTALALIDKSTLTGYLSPYIDAGVKLSGIAGASRFEQNSWAEGLLGVNGALLGDAARFGAAVAARDNADQITKKAIALAPFSTLLRLGYHVYNDR